MFQPQRVIFEKNSLDYSLGQALYHTFKQHSSIEIIELNHPRIKSHIPGENLQEQYQHGKKTLVVGIKKSLNFQTCKPSAHYQLPLVSGCMGQCEYCYLNTQLGDKPFVRVHVNLDEILNKASYYIEQRLPDFTLFEGAATSDPVPVEPYTHALERCILFFANQPHGGFRFVTKYTDIQSLISLKHNNHTSIRFSLNTQKVIETYEHLTASALQRIKACSQLAEAGYPIGFIIAPVFIYPNWEEDYHNLLMSLKEHFPQQTPHVPTFEIISHRYTQRAKERILQVFPETTLPMTEEDRTFKYGQFGYGKYIYPKEHLELIKIFFQKEIPAFFPQAEIKYII